MPDVNKNDECVYIKETDMNDKDISLLFTVYGVLHTLVNDNKCPLYKSSKCTFSILGSDEAERGLHELLGRLQAEVESSHTNTCKPQFLHKLWKLLLGCRYEKRQQHAKVGTPSIAQQSYLQPCPLCGSSEWKRNRIMAT
jgi:hypothetical protein